MSRHAETQRGAISLNGYDRHRTALVLLDFQNYGVHPRGYHALASPGWPPPAVLHAVEATERALTAARQHGLPVIHVGAAWRAGSPEMNRHIPVFARGPDRSVEGTWGAEFFESLKPAQGEIVIWKRSVSALAGTELDRLLRVQDITTLVLAGIATNFAVEGTAREAVDRGYGVVVLDDCCASATPAMHDFAVRFILAELCAVSSADAFRQWLRGADDDRS